MTANIRWIAVVGVEERLRELKAHFEWNDVQLGKAAGVSKQAVGRWVNGQGVPGRDPLSKLRRDYSINDEWILGRSEAMFIEYQRPRTTPLSPAQQRLLELTEKLSPDETERIVQVVEAMLAPLRK